MPDILDDKHKKVNEVRRIINEPSIEEEILETVIKIRPDKVVPNEYQSKCEILMDLCLKHFDRHRAMLIDDYNNLMTQAQEKYDGK